MRGFWKLTWTELKLFFREPAAMVFTWMGPAIIMYIYWLIVGNWPVSKGLGSVDLLIPDLIVITSAQSGLVGIATLVTSYRESGIFRRLRATPLHPNAILGSDLLVMLFGQVGGILLMLVVGHLFIGLRFFGSVVNVVGAFLLCSTSFCALGFAVAGFVRGARTAQSLAMLLFIPMTMLSGPASSRVMMPVQMQTAAEFLPAAHAIDLLRGLWIGASWTDHASDAGLLVGMLLMAIAVSWTTFRWE